MESFSKYNYEIFPVSCDFEDVLASGEAISLGSSAVEVYEDDAAETDRTSNMIVGASTAVSGTSLLAKIQAGTEGSTYYVKFKAVTDSSNKYEEIVKLTVLSERGS